MANHHFGEIGDVWKHLPLLAIATIEQPMAYWESHAGSAAYAWEESESRIYGAARFAALSDREPTLTAERYTALLKKSLEQDSPVYPGSPRLMLEALSGRGPEIVFCDLDASSISSIELDAERAGVRSPGLSCVVGDGNRIVIDRVGSLGAARAQRTLAMLDPFSLELVGEGGVSSLDALHALAGAGVKVMLWWCAMTPEERETRRMLVERACDGIDAATHTIIVGDRSDSRATAERLGVWSCSITLVNMSEESLRRSEELGSALARVYSDVASPEDGAPGLCFETLVHAPNGAAL